MRTPKLYLFSAMAIFGTIGLFVSALPLSSPAIACFRGFCGSFFLLAVLLLSRQTLHLKRLLPNLLLLCLSGAAIGINWILLFESYRHTTVATATVCYYLAPVFLLLACPLLGEKLTGKKLLCIAISLVGIVFVSGLPSGTLPTPDQWLGILLGLGAAVFYATVMFLNKKLANVPPMEKTIVQLLIAGVAICPYVLLTEGFPFSGLSLPHWGILLCVGILHTGAAYLLYFDAIGRLPATTVGIFSYLDPVIAICLSWLILEQPMNFSSIFGTILILGSAVYSELPEKKGKAGG